MPGYTHFKLTTTLKRCRAQLALIAVSLALISCTVAPPTSPATSDEAAATVQATADTGEDSAGETASDAGGDAGESNNEQAATDPFAYCAAVGTIDSPELDFGGPSNPGIPEAVAAGLRQASGTTGDAPVAENSYWRCMDGQVYACFVGANLPCASKSDTSTTPSDAMSEFCAGQPDADIIPAAVTGRDTVYAWSCNGDTAEAGEQVIEVDAQGYPADFWYEIEPATTDTNQ